MDAILNTAKSWLTDFFDPAVKKEIQDLIANDTEELKDRFYKNMEFGTGGMRGVMGVVRCVVRWLPSQLFTYIAT